MRVEVERSSANISTASQTTKNLQGTTENYEKLSGTLEESRGLIRDLWKKNRNDMIYIFGALGVFLATVMWVIIQRTPGIVWLPGKIILKQLQNVASKHSGISSKFVERVVEMTEAVLSDSEEAPKMFVDQIQISQRQQTDEPLKEENERKEEYVDHVIIERSELEKETTEKPESDNGVPDQVEKTTTSEQVQMNISTETTAEKPLETESISEPKVEETPYESQDSDDIHREIIEGNVEEPVTMVEPTKTEVLNDKIVQIASNSEIQPTVNEHIKIGEPVSAPTTSVETHIVEPTITENCNVETTNSKDLSFTIETPAIINEAVITEASPVIPETTFVSTEAPTDANEMPSIITETSFTSNEGSSISTDPVTVAGESPETVKSTETPINEVPSASEVTLKPSEAAETVTISETTSANFTQEIPLIITTIVSAEEKTFTSANLVTESVYSFILDTEFEGSQSNFSSEADLYNGTEEKMDL